MNVPNEEAGVAGPGRSRRCPTCRQTKTAAEFYAGCAECKPCKRGRSKRNRDVQAHKLEVVERLIDVLAGIAARTVGQLPQGDIAAPAEAAA
jgi:hypothetical protein